MHFSCQIIHRGAGLGLLLLGALLSACGGGGGGGGGTTSANAVVISISEGRVLEGNTGTTLMPFTVTLNRAASAALEVTYQAGVVAVAGTSNQIPPLNTATGGSACTPGVDFITVTDGRLTIPAGASTGTFYVTVCADTDFEPNETFAVNSALLADNNGRVTGTIVNDDAGGLNGTGSVSMLGGVAAFGRDADTLTNSSLDGPLGFSFAKATDCTTDNVSGLVWLRSESPTAVDFNGAGSYRDSVNALGSPLCGRTDWRIPTASELLSLMNASSKASDIPFRPNADAFDGSNIMSGMYWTKEEGVTGALSTNAFALDASNNGVVSFVAKTSLLRVRLVRGGTATAPACDNSDSRFSVLTDGTVRDTRTELVWKQCPEGTSGTSCATGAVASYSTADAFVTQMNAVNTASFAGRTDWRFPSRNEIASLINRACTGNFAAPASVFPVNGTLNYVSGTLDANATASRVWSANYVDGGVGPVPITAGMHLRLVRGGQ